MSDQQQHAPTTTTTEVVALVGDSDIARWPQELWPNNNHDSVVDVLVSGYNGATLRDMYEPIERMLEQHAPNVIVICAGENDIGVGIHRSQSVAAMERLVRLLQRQHNNKTHTIFLGPKLEPWLLHDTDARKAYIRLSQALERCCCVVEDDKRHQTQLLHFVDCLTMFCTTDTANVPGALWGNRAVPDTSFFDRDQLHLSDKGYRVWKEVVERTIDKLSDKQSV